ncbi:hypothetical protein [uncultured Microbacterium sp.]|jgi:hypothetical protein|uniref:hypothetical protein n=1 Tax=uncultured Microbacterium sp. TaxID=191216 RepID=UPI0025FB17B2|nr:hypothetical protein [uncultured Microbacterium sp.]
MSFISSTSIPDSPTDCKDVFTVLSPTNRVFEHPNILVGLTSQTLSFFPIVGVEIIGSAGELLSFLSELQSLGDIVCAAFSSVDFFLALFKLSRFGVVLRFVIFEPRLHKVTLFNAELRRALLH